jgi:MFS family permease
VTSDQGTMETPMGGDAPATPKVSASSWYMLAVLTLISLFSYMDRTAVSILLEPIRIDLGLTNSELGLISGMAFVLLYATCGLPLARLADRTSRVRLLAVCLGVWSAMTVVCGLARTFPQLFLARMGVGVGEAGCNPAAHSLLGDTFPRERRALAIGIFQSGAAFGGSIGLFLIGFIGQEYGWRAALQVVGLAGAPVILLVLFTLKDPPRPLVHGVTGERFTTAMSAVLRRPAFVYLITAYALVSLASAGISNWTPTFLLRSYGMNLAEIGGWYGATSAVGSILGLVTGGFFVSRLMRRDPRWELWISAGAYSIALPLNLAMILSPEAWMVLVFNSANNYFSAMGAGAALSAVQSFAEPRRRATAVAMMMFLSALLGAGGGSYIIGVLTDVLIPQFGQESLRYAMLIANAMIVPGILGFTLAGMRSPKDRVT